MCRVVCGIRAAKIRKTFSFADPKYPPAHRPATRHGPNLQADMRISESEVQVMESAAHCHHEAVTIFFHIEAFCSMVSLRNSSGGRLNGSAGEQATEASNDKGGPRKIALTGNAAVRILVKARAKKTRRETSRRQRVSTEPGANDMPGRAPTPTDFFPYLTTPWTPTCTRNRPSIT